MKKLITLWAILVSSMLSGCSKVVYTHLQAMQQYKTMQDVLNGFGIPDQKKEGEDTTEEWMYNESAYIKPANSKDSTIYQTANANTIMVTEFTVYPKYVRFSFDSQGNVVGFDTSGVDFSRKKPHTVGTFFASVGAGILAVAVIAAIIWVNDYLDSL